MSQTTTDQRRHEAPEVGDMICRMLNALVRRAAEGDTEALEQLARVEDMAGAALSSGLAVAHSAAGYSWAELAAVTGTSRQAVSQRVNKALAPALCEHHLCTGRKRCLQP